MLVGAIALYLYSQLVSRLIMPRPWHSFSSWNIRTPLEIT
jgi:hypothetical protein